MSTSESMQSLPENKSGPRKVWYYLKQKFGAFFGNNDNMHLDKEPSSQCDTETDELEDEKGN